MDELTKTFAANGDLAHLALFLWASGASGVLLWTLRELARANQRFEDFVKEIAALNQLFKRKDTATNPALGVTPFAKGGVISAPSYFPMGQGLGLAGEAGREAILPLRRGADGRLGVAAESGAVNVTFNVTASDARSFGASEAEISAMLLRAVKRGTRGS